MYSHQLYIKSSALFEEIFTQFHQTLASEVCSFEILATSQNVAFMFTAEAKVAEVVRAQIYSIAPAADIIPYKDPSKSFASNPSFLCSEISLTKASVFPIKTFRKIEGDSLSGLLNILCSLSAGEVAYIQLVLAPKADTSAHQVSIRTKKAKALMKHGVNPKYWLKREVGSSKPT